MLRDKEARTEGFRAKNAARKRGKADWFSRTQRREARQLRQQTIQGGMTPGAFGDLKPRSFNERIPGTTGSIRNVRPGEDEEEVAA